MRFEQLFSPIAVLLDNRLPKAAAEVVGSNLTEPANYRGSYIAGSKQVVDTKIAMSQSASRVIIDIVNIACGTTITSAMQISLAIQTTYAP